jgi:hypothetical protein
MADRIERSVAMYAVYGMDIGPTTTKLLYDRTDPLAVSIDFGDDNVWTFGRELLQDGLWRTAGDGDVRIHSTVPGWVTIALSSPHGIAVLLADRSPIEAFVADVKRAGAAELDLDGCVSKLLEGR